MVVGVIHGGGGQSDIPGFNLEAENAAGSRPSLSGRNVEVGEWQNSAPPPAAGASVVSAPAAVDNVNDNSVVSKQTIDYLLRAVESFERDDVGSSDCLGLGKNNELTVITHAKFRRTENDGQRQKFMCDLYKRLVDNRLMSRDTFLKLFFGKSDEEYYDRQGNFVKEHTKGVLSRRELLPKLLGAVMFCRALSLKGAQAADYCDEMIERLYLYKRHDSPDNIFNANYHENGVSWNGAGLRKLISCIRGDAKFTDRLDDRLSSFICGEKARRWWRSHDPGIPIDAYKEMAKRLSMFSSSLAVALELARDEAIDKLRIEECHEPLGNRDEAFELIDAFINSPGREDTDCPGLDREGRFVIAKHSLFQRTDNNGCCKKYMEALYERVVGKGRMSRECFLKCLFGRSGDEYYDESGAFVKEHTKGMLSYRKFRAKLSRLRLWLGFGGFDATMIPSGNSRDDARNMISNCSLVLNNLGRNERFDGRNYAKLDAEARPYKWSATLRFEVSSVETIHLICSAAVECGLNERGVLSVFVGPEFAKSRSNRWQCADFKAAEREACRWCNLLPKLYELKSFLEEQDRFLQSLDFQDQDLEFPVNSSRSTVNFRRIFP